MEHGKLRCQRADHALYLPDFPLAGMRRLWYFTLRGPNQALLLIVPDRSQANVSNNPFEMNFCPIHV